MRVIVLTLAVTMVVAAAPATAGEVEMPLNGVIQGFESGFIPGEFIPPGRCPDQAGWMYLTEGDGAARQLGLFEYASEHCSWPVRPLPDGALGALDAGELIMTFRRGDELHLAYSGAWRFIGDLDTGQGFANIRQTFTVTGGTGRFEGASGGGSLNGIIDFGQVTLNLSGTLILDS